MPVAAIEALVELLAHAQASTISETLDLLRTSIDHLKSRIANPISLSAGTDLFQQYLLNALQRPASSTSAGAAAGSGSGQGPTEDFKSIRQHLISNGRLFVTRAKASREKIASFARNFVRDGTTVLTNGGSRVVGALLRHAAEDSNGSVRFRVIYVLRAAGASSVASSGGDGDDVAKEEFKNENNDKHKKNNRDRENEGMAVVKSLRERGVPVAVIGEGAVGYAMGKVDMVIVGAEGVVENGGIISRLGTYQIALLARAARKPFYVVAESHKFVRLYPLGQYDLPIEQNVIEFKTGNEEEDDEDDDHNGDGHHDKRFKMFDLGEKESRADVDRGGEEGEGETAMRGSVGSLISTLSPVFEEGHDDGDEKEKEEEEEGKTTGYFGKVDHVQPTTTTAFEIGTMKTNAESKDDDDGIGIGVEKKKKNKEKKTISSSSASCLVANGPQDAVDFTVSLGL